MHGNPSSRENMTPSKVDNDKGEYCRENPKHSKSEKQDLEKKRENVFW